MSMITKYKTILSNGLLDFLMNYFIGGNISDKKYHGIIPLHQALWDSYNVATARLGLELGYKSLERFDQKINLNKYLYEIKKFLTL